MLLPLGIEDNSNPLASLRSLSYFLQILVALTVWLGRGTHSYELFLFHFSKKLRNLKNFHEGLF